jgi:hypothetical protein
MNDIQQEKETSNKLSNNSVISGIQNTELRNFVISDLSEFPYVLTDDYVKSRLITSNSSKITSNHLDDCNCYRETLNYFIRQEILKKISNDSEDNDNSSNYKLLNLDYSEAANKKYFKENNKFSYNKALDNTSSFLRNHNLVCPYTYYELRNTVNLFAKDYDIEKAKVQMIVKSILSYQSSQLESNNYFINNGMFDLVSDKQGNARKKISSNEWYRMNLNEKIIDAVEKLDKMIEGSKSVNLNVNSDSISMDEVLNKFLDKEKESNNK